MIGRVSDLLLITCVLLALHVFVEHEIVAVLTPVNNSEPLGVAGCIVTSFSEMFVLAARLIKFMSVDRLFDRHERRIDPYILLVEVSASLKSTLKFATFANSSRLHRW